MRGWGEWVNESEALLPAYIAAQITTLGAVISAS